MHHLLFFSFMFTVCVTVLKPTDTHTHTAQNKFAGRCWLFIVIFQVAACLEVTIVVCLSRDIFSPIFFPSTTLCFLIILAIVLGTLSPGTFVSLYMKCIDDDVVGVKNDFRPLKRDEKQRQKCIDVNVNEGEHSNHIYLYINI